MTDWKEKCVWITGASSGIGLELARQLAERGAVVVLSARREDVLNEVAASLAGGSARHYVVPLDLSQPEQVLSLAQQKLSDLPPIDVLVNNGGISQRCYFLDAELSVYRSLMEVNYLGTVALTKAVLPQMVQRGSGSIVSVSSVAGKVGSKLRTGYSGAKFAVVGFMDCLRAEMADKGVNCLTICPGFVQTGIAINALNESGQSQGHNDPAIESGMPVDICCGKIIRAIEQGKDEVVIAEGIGVWGPRIKRFFPGLFNRIAARAELR